MTITNLFSDKEFYKRLFKLALPIAFQVFLLACVGASDTIMLGSLSQSAMSAVSLATRVQFIQNVIITGIVSALLLLGAQYYGKQDYKSVNDLFCISFRVCTVTSVIVAGACFFVPRFLMVIFTDQPELIDIGIDYLRIAALSYLLTGFSQCFLAMMKLYYKAEETAIISAVAVVLNIGLNAVLIFGLFGLPAMGASGAALATTISRIAELLLSLFFCLKNKETRPDFSRLFTNNKALSKDFAKQILPLTGASVIWTLGFTSYSAFMGHISIDAAAAMSVITVVRDLVMCFTRGLANGSTIIIGNELGSKNFERAKIYGDRFLILSLICGGITAALNLALVYPALAIIKLSAEAAVLFKSMMLIQALYVIGCAFNCVTINGVFTAGGDTNFDCYSLAVVMWCIAVPLAAAGTFFFHWSAPLVFVCSCLDEVGKIPWTLHHYNKHLWIRDLTR